MSRRKNTVTISVMLPTGEKEAQKPLEVWKKLRETFDLADQEGLPSDRMRIWYSCEAGQIKINIKGEVT